MNNESKFCRCNHNITAHKILKIKNESIKILLPWGEFTTVQVMSDTFKEGDWIDLQIKTNSANGRVSSYSIKYIGRTPAAFIPEDSKTKIVTN